MIIELFFNAIKKMRNNKCSIILAMVGIVVSTFVVLMIFTLSNVSKNIIIPYLTYKYPVLNTLTCRIEGGGEYSMTTDEIHQIENSEIPYIKEIIYQTDFSVSCNITDNECVQMYGVYKKPVSIKIIEGRFLSEQEATNDECFNVIISDVLAKKIFNNTENILNKTIEIHMDNNCIYQIRIIGVYKKLNEYSDTQVIYGSFDTVSKISGKIKPYKITGFSVNVSDISKADNVKFNISQVLNNRYISSSEYRYNIMTCDVLESSNTLVNLISTILIILSSIIFFVSAISIRNVILTIMQSYVRQIGISKAIGASENIICVEYLFQGIIIAFSGSIVGFVSSQLTIKILNNKMDSIALFIDKHYKMPFIYEANLNLYLTGVQSTLAFLFAIVIVIICCYNPVKKMAKMNVVDALRY